jgi:hypothetical protein
MENDDRPVGQILSRRDALKILEERAFLAVCCARATSTGVPTGSPQRAHPSPPQRWIVLYAPN